MNKDDHCSLTFADRFELYLSDPAIDRELLKVRRPAISVEDLPSSIYYKPVEAKKLPGKAGNKRGRGAVAASTKRSKKKEVKKTAA